LGSALFGAAACATVCSSLVAGSVVIIPGLCYSDDTTLIRLEVDGSEALVSITEIKVNDTIATIDKDQQVAWTRVVSTKEHLVNTSLLEFLLETSRLK
jgi:hypothetical protein